MKKNLKKFVVITLVLITILTSTYYQAYKTKAAGITFGALAFTVIFVGGCCVACDMLSNPDKYTDLKASMKDFGNATVENQKKIYEIEKANFEMVMQKAVDANVGTCLIGSDGKLYSATQLQAQEYPSFDIWKGYKEKESEKPKKSMWDKFKLLDPFVGLLCDLFPDSGGFGGGGSGETFFKGPADYYDEKTGNVHVYASSVVFNNVLEDGVCIDYDVVTDSTQFDFNVSHEDTDYCPDGYPRICFYYDTSWVSANNIPIGHSISEDIYTWGRTYITCVMYCNNYKGYTTPGQYTSIPGYDGMVDIDVFLDSPSSTYRNISCNLPIFSSRNDAMNYIATGDYSAALNLPKSDDGPSPTPSSGSDGYISPVTQYVNYFSNTYSPSVMPYYVNYNIVNNWDGDTNTFNINNYTVEESDDSGVTATPTPNLRKPTFTPIPHNTDDGDTTNNYDINITNNLLIEQTNIIQNISETVNNIYNFFQIDVDVIVEDLTPDTDSKFLPLYDMITDVNKLIPQDEFEVIEGQAEPIISTLYPKVTIKVPLVLDDFLSISDEKIMEKDGDKVIIMCDFYDYRIYFARFRMFLQVVIYIGMFFYLMKEFSVIWSIQ